MPNFKEAYEFIKDKEKQKEYNDKIVNKTWYYQNKFGFKTSPQKGHEFWNNEADAKSITNAEINPIENTTL